MLTTIQKMSMLAAAAISAATLAQPARVALVEIEGTPPETAGAASLFAPETPSTLRQLTTLIADAGNRDLDGLVVRLKDSALSLPQAEEIAAAIDAAQEDGVLVHVFGTFYGPTDLVVAASADEVLIQDGGGVSLPGLAIEQIYWADAFEWMGISADYVQVGDYKGAQDPYVRSGPSPEWDRNISSLLDAQYANLREPLKEGFGLSDRRLDRAMERLFMADAKTAIEVGMVDAAVDLPVLFESYLAESAYDDFDGVEYAGTLAPDDASTLDTSNPFAIFSQLFEPPTRRTFGPTIAVLHINGAIMDGESGGSLLGGQSVGSRTIRNAIEEILRDDNIEGIVVRIDSPGGSATASEIIWQGLRRASERKPVYVSVGSIAASGGYYILAGGDKVYVNPSSMVGSIGVVAGKLGFGEVLDRLEINVVTRTRGPRAGLMTMFSDWGEDDLKFLRGQIAETYEQFTDRVKRGRPGVDLDEVAAGRVFVGSDAVELGMADELGGLRDAIGDLAEELDLDEYAVMDFPAPPGLDQLLGGGLGLPGIEMAKRVLGERRFATLAPFIEAWGLMRDRPVVLVAPGALVGR
ncbi:MAG: S49 family peptidase [Planctomycetota bacterium]